MEWYRYEDVEEELRRDPPPNFHPPGSPGSADVITAGKKFQTYAEGYIPNTIPDDQVDVVGRLLARECGPTVHVTWRKERITREDISPAQFTRRIYVVGDEKLAWKMWSVSGRGLCVLVRTLDDNARPPNPELDAYVDRALAAQDNRLAEERRRRQEGPNEAEQNAMARLGL